jgi:hypothetical protein
VAGPTAGNSIFCFTSGLNGYMEEVCVFQHICRSSFLRCRLVGSTNQPTNHVACECCTLLIGVQHAGKAYSYNFKAFLLEPGAIYRLKKLEELENWERGERKGPTGLQVLRCLGSDNDGRALIARRRQPSDPVRALLQLWSMSVSLRPTTLP